MNHHPPLILASTSTYRAHELKRLRLSFQAVAPEVEENSYKNLGLTPHELAVTLARAKAQEVFKRFPDAVVIGGDQVAEVEGQILSKPETHSKALDQLSKINGRTHSLWTAICVISRFGEDFYVDHTQLTMRLHTPKQLEAYLNADRPYDCAGSYKLESGGIGLFEKISTNDYTAIIGIPLMELSTILMKHQLPLWTNE